MRKMEELNNE